VHRSSNECLALAEHSPRPPTAQSLLYTGVCGMGTPKGVLRESSLGEYRCATTVCLRRYRPT
jgi:hypothetical protein